MPKSRPRRAGLGYRQKAMFTYLYSRDTPPSWLAIEHHFVSQGWPQQAVYQTLSNMERWRGWITVDEDSVVHLTDSGFVQAERAWAEA